jgi:hypothetical protein
MGLSERPLLLFLILMLLNISGCLRYSFTGVSIPPDVRTIHFPFFPDQSPSGQPNLSEVLNEALLDQFVNQTSLRFNPDRTSADAILEGRITGYTSRLAVAGGSGLAQVQEVSITVTATFSYRKDQKPVFSKAFTANAQFDPNTNALQGERDAARTALGIIARNLFIDSLARW